MAAYNLSSGAVPVSVSTNIVAGCVGIFLIYAFTTPDPMQTLPARLASIPRLLQAAPAWLDNHLFNPGRCMLLWGCSSIALSIVRAVNADGPPKSISGDIFLKKDNPAEGEQYVEGPTSKPLIVGSGQASTLVTARQTSSSLPLALSDDTTLVLPPIDVSFPHSLSMSRRPAFRSSVCVPISSPSIESPIYFDTTASVDSVSQTLIVSETMCVKSSLGRDLSTQKEQQFSAESSKALVVVARRVPKSTGLVINEDSVLMSDCSPSAKDHFIDRDFSNATPGTIYILPPVALAIQNVQSRITYLHAVVSDLDIDIVDEACDSQTSDDAENQSLDFLASIVHSCSSTPLTSPPTSPQLAVAEKKSQDETTLDDLLDPETKVSLDEDAPASIYQDIRSEVVDTTISDIIQFTSLLSANYATLKLEKLDQKERAYMKVVAKTRKGRGRAAKGLTPRVIAWTIQNQIRMLSHTEELELRVDAQTKAEHDLNCQSRAATSIEDSPGPSASTRSVLTDTTVSERMSAAVPDSTTAVDIVSIAGGVSVNAAELLEHDPVNLGFEALIAEKGHTTYAHSIDLRKALDAVFEPAASPKPRSRMTIGIESTFDEIWYRRRYVDTLEFDSDPTIWSFPEPIDSAQLQEHLCNTEPSYFNQIVCYDKLQLRNLLWKEYSVGDEEQFNRILLSALLYLLDGNSSNKVERMIHQGLADLEVYWWQDISTITDAQYAAAASVYSSCYWWFQTAMYAPYTFGSHHHALGHVIAERIDGDWYRASLLLDAFVPLWKCPDDCRYDVRYVASVAVIMKLIGDHGAYDSFRSFLENCFFLTEPEFVRLANMDDYTYPGAGQDLRDVYTVWVEFYHVVHRFKLLLPYIRYLGYVPEAYDVSQSNGLLDRRTAKLNNPQHSPASHKGFTGPAPGQHPEDYKLERTLAQLYAKLEARKEELAYLRQIEIEQIRTDFQNAWDSKTEWEKGCSHTERVRKEREVDKKIMADYQQNLQDMQAAAQQARRNCESAKQYEKRWAQKSPFGNIGGERSNGANSVWNGGSARAQFGNGYYTGQQTSDAAGRTAFQGTVPQGGFGFGAKPAKTPFDFPSHTTSRGGSSKKSAGTSRFFTGGKAKG